MAEYDSAGTLLRRYVHGPGIDEPLVWYEGATTTNKNWLYADHLGSIVATANSAGTSTATYTYGPYGEPNVTTGVRFRYTGQQLIGQLNLYYYKARFYSPALGRFLQTDPIGYADDLNLYAYVGGDPVNLTDPTGNCPSCIGAVTSVALGYGISLFTGQAYTAADALRDAALGAVGAGIVSKINTARKLGEINQLTNYGRNLVTSGAAPKYTSTISQSVTKAEANQLGQSFTKQGSQFSYRAPAPKVRTGNVQANFESTVLKSSGNPKTITNIHANVTRLGTSVKDGIVGGVVGGSVSASVGESGNVSGVGSFEHAASIMGTGTGVTGAGTETGGSGGLLNNGWK